MKRVLILASVASMIDQFNMTNIELLRKMGYEVDVACNFEKGNTCSVERINELKKTLKKQNVNYFQIDFERNIFKIHKNFKAYKQVSNLIKKNAYAFIHCHSPIGGVCGRIAGRFNNTKVIYTAHGFHFFKGAPLLNWLIYYPVELLLSRYTDVLININQEDYNRARKYFKAKKIEYIPGVGVNVNKFKETRVNRTEKRREIGVPEDAILLVSVGELNKNKNHEVIIRALAKLNNTRIHYILCGQGPLASYLSKLIKEYNLSDQVHLLGYRNDVNEIYKASDIFCFPSQREGLGLAAIEAMAAGLPIIASYVHGIKDYAENEISGYFCSPHDYHKFAVYIEKLINDEELRNRISVYNSQAAEKFDSRHTIDIMESIYREIDSDMKYNSINRRKKHGRNV